MRALFSGVTGIRSHQVRMDVIGNNIANVNTTAFKSSRVSFQDVFSQTMSAGSAQTTPQQVGLGVGLASTDLNLAAGSFQMTGRDMDLAIEGNGMFILKDGNGGQAAYTRAGNFDWDSRGFLVNPATGQQVQGWMADANGNFGNADAGSIGSIQVVKGGVTLAQKSAASTIGGNLDAGAAISGTPYTTTMTAYDSLGRPQTVALTFTKTADNNWSWSASGPAGASVTGSGTLAFGTDGTLQAASRTGSVSLSPAGAAAQTISLDFANVTQAFAGTSGSSVLVRKIDGAPMGTLESVSMDETGLVSGVYSNGFRRPLAQLATADFTNPAGLLKAGSSSFVESASSGAALVGKPATGSRGRLVPGNLEMSNVDLSTEFTQMIVTQRGFQANTKTISTADEMLQDLVNLRR